MSRPPKPQPTSTKRTRELSGGRLPEVSPGGLQRSGKCGDLPGTHQGDVLVVITLMQRHHLAASWLHTKFMFTTHQPFTAWAGVFLKECRVHHALQQLHASAQVYASMHRGSPVHLIWCPRDIINGVVEGVAVGTRTVHGLARVLCCGLQQPAASSRSAAGHMQPKERAGGPEPTFPIDSCRSPDPRAVLPMVLPQSQGRWRPVASNGLLLRCQAQQFAAENSASYLLYAAVYWCARGSLRRVRWGLGVQQMQVASRMNLGSQQAYVYCLIM